MTPSTRKKSKITQPYIVKSAKIRGPHVLAITANRYASKGFANLGGSDFFSGGCRSASRTERDQAVRPAPRLFPRPVSLGRHDAAIACYEQALVLNAALAEASHGLASTLQTLKQREGDPRAAKDARDLPHYRQP
jgi:hypothetical protein